MDGFRMQDELNNQISDLDALYDYGDVYSAVACGSISAGVSLFITTISGDKIATTPVVVLDVLNKMSYATKLVCESKDTKEIFKWQLSKIMDSILAISFDLYVVEELHHRFNQLVGLNDTMELSEYDDGCIDMEDELTKEFERVSTLSSFGN